MKKLGLVLGGLLAILSCIAMALPYFINKTAITNQLNEIIKTATGSDPVVMGEVSVSFFPLPKVLVTQVGIRNAPGTVTPYILQLQSVEIYPALSDVFSSKPRIDKLMLVSPIIEIENMPDGRLNLATVFTGAKSTYEGIFNLTKIKIPHVPHVEIVNGVVHYLGSANAKKHTFESVQGSVFHADNTLKLNINSSYRNKTSNANASIGLTQEGADSPFDFAINLDGHQIGVKGVLKQQTQGISMQGDVSCKTDNILDLLNFFKEKTAANEVNPLLTSIPLTNDSKLPIHISSKFDHSANKSQWNDIKIESAFLNARANLAMEILDKSSVLSIDVDNIDFDAFRSNGLLSLLSHKEDLNIKEKVGNAALQTLFFGVPEDEAVEVKINAKNITLNKQVLSLATIEGEIAGGSASISNAKFSLPGDSQAIFIGNVKQGFQGITFEGALDVWGQNFLSLMPLLFVDLEFFPKDDFKRFRFKAEQFVVSPVETRLIESKLQVENMGFAGTVIANYSDKLKIESRLVTSNINFDHVLETHKDVFSGDIEKPVYLKLPALISNWLKTLTSEYSVRVVFQNYLFSQQLRDRADVELIISPSKFNLVNVSAQYNGVNFKLGASVENIADKPLPKYSINFSSDKLIIGKTTNASVESATPLSATDSLRKDWSKEQFDVSWLDDIDVSFDINIKNLNYGDLILDNFSAKGVAVDRTLTLDPVRANVWGANLASKFTLSGGKLPLMSAAFKFNNIALDQLKQVTPLFSALSGKFNISGVLSSSGISPYFMISNLGGKVGVAGRDVMVKGFNLRGIISSVAAVRSIADILNVVRLAFPGGDTLIDTVQGNFFIDKGKAQTLGIAISTNESKGTMKSVLDLVNWKMDTDISFDFSSLDKQRPPSIKMQFNGDMENPKISLDTKSLEEFVALKTKEKYLQDIPPIQ